MARGASPLTITADELVPADDELSRLRRLEPEIANGVTFGFDATSVAVRFADAEPARVFASRYRHLRSRSAPTITVFVANDRGATYFWLPGARAFRFERPALSPRGVAFLADAVTTTHVFSSLAEGLALHAGAVGDASGAAAIVGTTCAGKTTTALACVRRGLALYSDEFCVVTPRGVVPFPRTLNIRAGGSELLARDDAPPSPLDSWLAANRGADRDDIGFEELFGAYEPAPPRPLRALFSISGHGRIPVAEAMPAAVLLPDLLPWTRQRAGGIDGAAALLRLLHGVACYRLVLGMPDATSRVIADILAS